MARAAAGAATGCTCGDAACRPMQARASKHRARSELHSMQQRMHTILHCNSRPCVAFTRRTNWHVAKLEMPLQARHAEPAPQNGCMKTKILYLSIYMQQQAIRAATYANKMDTMGKRPQTYVKYRPTATNMLSERTPSLQRWDGWVSTALWGPSVACRCHEHSLGTCAGSWSHKATKR